MTTTFIYNKKHFRNHIIGLLTRGDDISEDIKYTKELLDNISGVSKACKERAIKIVRRFYNGQEWWLTDEAKELTMLWRCYRLKLANLYNPQTVSEYSYERLADAESDLENGIINEQKYIDRCNHIKKRKEEDEALLDACACKTISSMNVNEEGQVCLTVICLPHDFNATATVL
jgi:hypothetical protein